MRIRTIIILLVIACATTISVAQNSSLPETIKALEAKLNAAIEDDKPIVLSQDSDFLKPPGAAISMPRHLGQKRLIELARADEPELSMLYLPEWEVWLTQTKVRWSDELRIDTRYIEAALAAGMKVETWHTHNNVTSEVLTKEELFRRSIQWTMPSPKDMRQLYTLSRIIPGANLRGVIASTHGVTIYWNDDPSWAAPTYVGYAVQNEAEQLYKQTDKLSLGELTKFALNHKGFVSLRFELASDNTALK